jgi:hypothetical protein
MQSLPAKHQTLLFSATMPKEIEGLSAQVGRRLLPWASVPAPCARGDACRAASSAAAR